MAKHKDHLHEGSVAVEEAVSQEQAVEVPKTKVGDKPETAVDVKEKKTRKVTPKGNSTYRILEGVEAAKFAGQRGHVIRSLQKLAQSDPEASHSLETIVANIEGLVSKTPVEASVSYHLKGLVADGQVVQTVVPVAAPAATVAA